MKDEIASGYDTWFVDLEEHLLPVAEILGIVLPEADSWRQKRAEGEKQQAARQAELVELNQRFKEPQARGSTPLFGRGRISPRRRGHGPP